ncbi:MAG: hypothetical protein AB1696_14945 [Planctomycetota bacterium]
MARRKPSRGKCAFCGREMTRGSMQKHLSACSKAQEAIRRADGKKGPEEDIYRLLAKDAWGGTYWLCLEMRGATTLADLDYYLRAIWLECCGHMSMFSIDGWRGKEISKRTSVEAAFAPGEELTHIYDFGTSSHTLIKPVAVRKGRPLTRHPVALLARNEPPEIPCMECGEPASVLCVECLIEDEKTGALCDRHAQDHPHDEYGEPIPVVNSPRLGMCGYTGPADPPY